MSAMILQNVATLINSQIVKKNLDFINLLFNDEKIVLEGNMVGVFQPNI